MKGIFPPKSSWDYIKIENESKDSALQAAFTGLRNFKQKFPSKEEMKNHFKVTKSFGVTAININKSFKGDPKIGEKIVLNITSSFVCYPEVRLLSCVDYNSTY